MREVLVVGESLVDVVEAVGTGARTERPGGSAANVAVALARLGIPVRLATAFADDERGHAVAAHLADAGVDLASDPHVVPRTASAQATIGDDGAASYTFDVEWRLGPIVADPPPAFLHVCSLGAVLEPGATDVLRLLDDLAAAGSTFVSYDVNARPSITGTGPDVVAAVEAVAARSHLVKASDEDLAALYPALSVEAAAAHLRGLGPARAVVVTRGAAGSTWFGDGAVSASIRSSAVVDTIGAGDTFSAAMIDALWDDLDRNPAEVLDHAHRAAAVTVSRIGADPPTRAELRLWR